MIPRSTYRLQFHEGFTFDDALRIVPYLQDLGISHIYASPLTQARKGSTHGYDVTDPTRISADLGGEEGLRRLVAALRERNMGLILDIVPNHMAASLENGWWADMLEHGQGSDYTRFFDIDWSRHGGRIFLPFLGDPLSEVIEQGQLRLAEQDGRPVLRLYDEQNYPVAAGTLREGDVAATLAAQHYTLAWWRRGHDELNWRRFFSISELAGLRIEAPEVFEAVHRLPLRLYREGLIDGLRIDHVDGLTDPAAYLKRLRGELDALDGARETGPAWLIVEKILGPGETLPAEWPVDGTTGYEFMDQVSQLLHDPAAEEPLTQRWAELSGRPSYFEAEELLARRQMLHWEFTAQFEACIEQAVDLSRHSPSTARYSRAAWARAVETVLLLFPVYRTYGTGETAPDGDRKVREQIAARLESASPPGEAVLGRLILDWLAGTGPAAEQAAPFVARFQQLSAPIAAKAVEDTAFYRYGRLISRNDVGFDANRFSASIETFHGWQQDRAAHWPNSMLTTATHDHKRGEDTRARLYAVTALAEDWIAASRQWLDRLPGADRVDAGDLYMLLQAVFGAWPGADADMGRFNARVQKYARKALREAKLRSSWTAPDEDYEAAVSAVLESLLVSGVGAGIRQDINAFVACLAPQEHVRAMAQMFLRNTCPGVPDLYRGAALPDRSLVDPDNRRPVNFDLRERLLEEGGSRQQTLIRDLLHLRRTHPGPFMGSYDPVRVEGAHASGLIAFTRGHGDDRLLMVCAITPGPDGAVPSFASGNTEAWRGTRLTSLGRSVAELGENLLTDDPPCGVWTLKHA